MEFLPYQKISSSTSQWECPPKVLKRLLSTPYVALEKVHGSNFSLYSDGVDVRFAKRSGFIEQQQWFYGYEAIADPLRDRTLLLVEALRRQHRVDGVIVYGELFGGFYPPDPQEWKGPIAGGRLNAAHQCLVPQEDRAVQEGIYYSPNVEFAAFDIAIVHSNTPTFLDHSTVVSLCEEVSLLVLKPRFEGTLAQCLDFPHIFDSQVPFALCGQRKLPPGTNVAEGLVLKPREGSLTLPSTGSCKGQEVALRPLLKRKHPSFAEVSADFTIPNVTPRMILAGMINVNRLNAVLSKDGRLEQAQVVANLLEDVWNDFYQHFPSVTVDNQAATEAFVQQKCSELVIKWHV